MAARRDRDVGSDGPSKTAEKLAAYARMLRESPHNLLSPKALLELESRHFPESAAFAEGLPPTARLLDIGSGGGLPGLIIAIVRPEIEVHLLEATGKKARFLAEVGSKLALDVTIHHGRAEDLAKAPLARSFDVVTSRAVAPMGRLAGWCAPYLNAGGRIHAIKGERWEEELEGARGAIGHSGLRVSSTPAQQGEQRTTHHPLVIVLERRA